MVKKTSSDVSFSPQPQINSVSWNSRLIVAALDELILLLLSSMVVLPPQSRRVRLLINFLCSCFRFMNRRASANCRYQPTCYEHAANCYTHAVRGVVDFYFFKRRHLNHFLFFFLNKFFSPPVAAPHRAGRRRHGSAASPVGQRLGEDHRLGVRHGPVRPLPRLHCVSHHHLEEEPHEVRSCGCRSPTVTVFWRGYFGLLPFFGSVAASRYFGFQFLSVTVKFTASRHWCHLQK